jgi:hypothetical protein
MGSDRRMSWGEAELQISGSEISEEGGEESEKVV